MSFGCIPALPGYIHIVSWHYHPCIPAFSFDACLFRKCSIVKETFDIPSVHSLREKK